MSDSAPTGPHRFDLDGWISLAPFERMLNIEITEAADGHATLKMPFLVDLAQGAGLMHGGALVSLADTAVAIAIKTLLPPLSHFATISLHSKFLLPVKRGVVTANAHIVERSGRIFKGQSTVRDDQNRAVMEFTCEFKIAASTRSSGL
ncbi:MAG: PaaI family thioesterase [Syntrophobacteraceae bacterium]|nr:PaaI family thioesterase [Syntrophobacteraceae bacterium]